MSSEIATLIVTDVPDVVVTDDEEPNVSVTRVPLAAESRGKKPGSNHKVERLNSMILELQAEVQKLQSDNALAAHKLRGAEELSAVLSKDFCQLQTQLEALAGEKRVWTSERDGLLAEISTLEGSKEALECLVDDIINKARQCDLSLTGSISHEKGPDRLPMARNVIDELFGSMRLGVVSGTSHVECLNLRRTKAVMEREVAVLREIINRQDGRYQEAMEVLHNVRALADLIEDEALPQNRARAAELELQNSTLRKELDEAQSEIRNLENRNLELSASAVGLTSELKSCQSELQRLQGEHVVTLSERSKLVESVGRHAAEFSSTQDLVRSQATEMRELHASLMESAVRLSDANAQNAKLKLEMEILSRRLQETSTQFGERTKALNLAEEQLRESQRLFQEMSSTLSLSQQKVAYQDGRLESSAKEIERLSQDLSELGMMRSSVGSLSVQNQKLLTNLSTSAAKLKSQRRTLRQLQTENQVLLEKSMRVSDLSVQLEERDNTLQRLMNSLEREVVSVSVQTEGFELLSLEDGQVSSRPIRRSAQRLLRPQSSPVSLRRFGVQTHISILPGQGPESFRSGSSIALGDRVLCSLPPPDDPDLLYHPASIQGTVKYIGRLGSKSGEVFLGVKLDEPLGDCDGVFRDQQLFKCLPLFGKFIPLSDVVAVKPSKGTRFQPLKQGLSMIQ